jgi:chemotaxis protein MotB
MLPRKKKQEEGSPQWMTTFSDLMTLLLVFFVLLYSFSVIDVEKFQRFMASFQGAGILDRGTEPLKKDKEKDFDVPSDVQQKINEISKLNPLAEIYFAVQEYISDNNLETDISVKFNENGVALEIKDKILFESAKAELKLEALKILRELAGLFNNIPYTISVEGHTDNRPIHSAKFSSNWELSAARALSVVRFLTDRIGLDPHKFCAVGYGEYHPVAPNDSPSNMAKNRRVVIVINSRNPYFEEGVE